MVWFTQLINWFHCRLTLVSKHLIKKGHALNLSLTHSPCCPCVDATLRANKDTRDFYDKSVTAEIDDNLKYSCGVTVFAVQGDQFGDYLSPVEKRYLSQPEGRDDLAKILKHQIASKIYYSDDFPEGNSTIKTVEGTEDLDVYVENNKGAPSAIQVNGVRVIRSDILAANGMFILPCLFVCPYY